MSARSKKRKDEQRADAAVAQRQQQIVSQEVTASFRGPIPPPDMLARYEEIVPGSAAKLLEQAERQTEHRMSSETMVLKFDIQRQKLGVAAGLIAVLAGFALAGSVAAIGHPWPGVAAGGMELAAIVAVFVTGDRSERNERREKMGMMTRR